LNPYQAPKIKELKETILDIRCKEIAISMLKDNEPLEKIAKYTSLSIEELYFYS
jgi:hypothetical protein